jgi:tellurite resistance protein TehA-like permease
MVVVVHVLEVSLWRAIKILVEEHTYGTIVDIIAIGFLFLTLGHLHNQILMDIGIISHSHGIQMVVYTITLTAIILTKQQTLHFTSLLQMAPAIFTLLLNQAVKYVQTQQDRH